MIERRCGVGFVNEALLPPGVGHDVGAEHLDRDAAVQAVSRALNTAPIPPEPSSSRM